MGVPLRLNSAEQELLAQVCSLLRGWVYLVETGNEKRDALELVSQLEAICDRFDVSPQHLDGLYDRLHRTGANG
jgi:hypothetical protein